MAPEMTPDDATQNLVRNRADLLRLDGRRGQVTGEYRVIPRPARGNAPSPEDYAVVVLADGTSLFLETFATPLAQRPAAERQRFNGRRVRVVGTIHQRMPTLGQGPIGASIDDIQSIQEVAPAD